MITIDWEAVTLIVGFFVFGVVLLVALTAFIRLVWTRAVPMRDRKSRRHENEPYI